MKTTNLSMYFSLRLMSVIISTGLLIPLTTLAQNKPFKIATKIYPIDLLHNRYNALHGGIEIYKRPFSLHFSYGTNAGIKLSNQHEAFQNGYKYKTGVRYYLSFKDTARTSLPSGFIQVLYSYLNYTQERHNDRYNALSGKSLSYESTQLQTRRGVVETMIGKNFVVYQRLMVEASIGAFAGYINNRYSNQTELSEYDPPADNFGWLLPSNTKYRDEGRSFIVRPAASIGLAYWLW